MKHVGLKIGCGLLLTCIVVASTATAIHYSATNGSDAQLLTAAVAGENELLKVGVVPAQTLLQQNLENSDLDGSLDAQLLELSQDSASLEFQKYYSDGIAEKYQAMQESIQITPTELTVDSGTMDAQLLYTQDLSNTEKQLQFSFVSWLTTIYETEGQYTVVVIFNQDTITKTMVLEDGVWKTQSVNDHQKEFAPENYVPEKGTFDTLEEALQFVVNMDVESENPFS